MQLTVLISHIDRHFEYSRSRAISKYHSIFWNSRGSITWKWVHVIIYPEKARILLNLVFISKSHIAITVSITFSLLNPLISLLTFNSACIMTQLLPLSTLKRFYSKSFLVYCCLIVLPDFVSAHWFYLFDFIIIIWSL